MNNKAIQLNETFLYIYMQFIRFPKCFLNFSFVFFVLKKMRMQKEIYKRRFYLSLLSCQPILENRLHFNTFGAFCLLSCFVSLAQHTHTHTHIYSHIFTRTFFVQSFVYFLSPFAVLESSRCCSFQFPNIFKNKSIDLFLCYFSSLDCICVPICLYFIYYASWYLLFFFASFLANRLLCFRKELFKSINHYIFVFTDVQIFSHRSVVQALVFVDQTSRIEAK